MRIIAWNINGIRATMATDDLTNLIKDEKPDVICFGETKLSCPIDTTSNKLDKLYPSYKYKYYSTCSVKKGYSGTAIFSKKKPINAMYGLDSFDSEGRVITLEFKEFYLIHVYTPNSGELLARLKYRVDTWDFQFRKYIEKLQKHKPTIVCGDLNVANEPIDLHDPAHNTKTAGYTIEERDSFKKLLDKTNLVDYYRFKYPNKVEYTYWSYRRQAKKKNKGWRIDYFLISQSILKNVKKMKILSDVHGSDHAPIKLNLTFK